MFGALGLSPKTGTERMTTTLPNVLAADPQIVHGIRESGVRAFPETLGTKKTSIMATQPWLL